jgi:hypothetical protein
MLRQAALSFLLVACASTPKPASVEAPPAAARAVPDSVGGVGLSRTEKYPDRRLGTLYRYAQGDFRPDVYVYDKADWSDPQGQARSFIEALEINKRRGEFDSFDVLLTRSINLDANGRILPGHEIVLKMHRRNEPRDSYFAVVSLPNEYVKFRITQVPSETSIVKARDFVNGWISKYAR